MSVTNNSRCGVTGLAPRVDEAYPILARLDESDCKAIAKQFGVDVRPPGLYHVVEDVAKLMRQRVAKRLGKKVNELTRYDLV
jgi:hypothetical protein